jgi:hypothetical protein
MHRSVYITSQLLEADDLIGRLTSAINANLSAELAISPPLSTQDQIGTNHPQTLITKQTHLYSHNYLLYFLA